VSDWDQLSDLMATLAAASLAWVSSVLAPGLPLDTSETAGSPALSVNHQGLMIGWAQAADEPPIEQVGEDTGEDVETLDEAAPPVEDVATEEDIETLDEGPPPAAVEEDIELLDQGSPPTTTEVPVTEIPAPEPVAVAPVTTYIVPEPVVASGPVVPEGFGTGSVHVSTGSTGFPVGLGDCHVGAVTGRAYVGIDCGDGSSFVGHAPSFEEFPFVVDEGFPFNRDSVFADLGASDSSDNASIFVSASQDFPFEEEASAPEIRTSGTSSVEFAQKSRDRKPRVETNSRGSYKRNAEVTTRGDNNARETGAGGSNDRARTASKEKESSGEKDKKNRANDRDNQKKSKKQGAKKGKKGRG
jgi:hypothetical protein